MFSFQGTSRQKKLHIVRFRRQAHASRRKLTHSVLLPFQIRPASLGSNLVWVTAESLFKGSLKSPLGDFNQPSKELLLLKNGGPKWTRFYYDYTPLCFV